MLSKASEALQEKLRGDDSNPDLINQFSDTVGCHKYYIEPYREEGSLVSDVYKYALFTHVCSSKCMFLNNNICRMYCVFYMVWYNMCCFDVL